MGELGKEGALWRFQSGLGWRREVLELGTQDHCE